MADKRLVARLIDFCRAGYPPAGVPQHGFMPLLVLLKRRLADDEVESVGNRCCGAGPPITQRDISDLVEQLLRESPGTDDVPRVSEYLARTGWLVIDGAGQPIPETPAHPDTSRKTRMRTQDTQWSGPRLVAWMADLAAELTDRPRIEDVFAEVCAAAVESIPGADLADIMLVREGQVFSLGATSQLAGTLDELQQQLGEGPCAQATGDTAIVRADDLGTDPRWPRYSPEALKLGVRSCLSFKLYSVGQTAATMNVFGHRAGAWDDDAETTGAILAAHAAAAITASTWGAEMDTPLCSRERIGQAKGIIMERYGLDDVAAFALLKQLSENAHIGLLDSAQRIIDTCATT
jgi:hypothetical protein